MWNKLPDNCRSASTLLLLNQTWRLSCSLHLMSRNHLAWRTLMDNFHWAVLLCFISFFNWKLCLERFYVLYKRSFYQLQLLEQEEWQRFSEQPTCWLHFCQLLLMLYSLMAALENDAYPLQVVCHQHLSVCHESEQHSGFNSAAAALLFACKGS